MEPEIQITDNTVNQNQNKNNDTNSNNNTNAIFKNETSNKNQIPKIEEVNNLKENNEENLIDKNISEQSSSSSMSSWILYLIVIGISIYFILQNTDPINIGFTSLGCAVTLFLLHKTLNRKIYKLEDDDDGVNLIEGY
jgi:hypothetical protein